MDILLDIVHSVDYGVLAYISEHWRGGLSDTVWKVFSLLGSYGAVWITLAVLLLFFRRTRRVGAAMLIALGAGCMPASITRPTYWPERSSACCAASSLHG